MRGEGESSTVTTVDFCTLISSSPLVRVPALGKLDKAGVAVELARWAMANDSTLN